MKNKTRKHSKKIKKTVKKHKDRHQQKQVKTKDTNRNRNRIQKHKKKSIKKRFVKGGAVTNEDFEKLILLIKNGNLDGVKKSILDNKDLIFFQDKNGITSLMISVGFKNENILKLLLENGAREIIDLKNKEGSNALMLSIATPEPNENIVKILLENGASETINAQEYIQNVTALMLAVQNQSENIVKMLLNNGAKEGINLKEKSTNSTALNIAIGSQNAKIVQLLLESGADVNVQNYTGLTPLAKAMVFLNIDIIDLLLKYGAVDTINLQDDKGLTPLSWVFAVGENRNNKNVANIVNLLLQKGAMQGINIQDMYGQTALIFAIRNKYDDNIIKLLLESGASVNIQDSKGQTPLMFALLTQNDNENLIKLLLEYGADPTLQANNGITALKLAKSKSKIENFIKIKTDEFLKNKNKLEIEAKNKDAEKNMQKLLEELEEEETKQQKDQETKSKKANKRKEKKAAEKAAIEASRIEEAKKILEQQEKENSERIAREQAEKEQAKMEREKKEQKLIERQQEIERKLQEEEQENIRKATNESLKTLEEMNLIKREETKLLEYWTKYFDDNIENLFNFKNIVSNLMKNASSSTKLREILPAYSNKFENRFPDTDNMISLLFMIIGILSNNFSRKGILLLLKGGSAIQNVGSQLPNNFIVPYETNDIDIILINANENEENNKKMAEKICEFLVWITNDHNNSKLNYENNKDITHMIYKVKIISIDKPVIDVDYNSLPADIMPLYERDIYSNNFELDGINGKFMSPGILNLIYERIYYLIKYTSNEEIKNSKNRKFLEKISKSINYLAKVYFIILNKREMTENESNLFYSELFSNFFKIEMYSMLKMNFERTHSYHDIDELIEFCKNPPSDIVK